MERTRKRRRLIEMFAVGSLVLAAAPLPVALAQPAPPAIPSATRLPLIEPSPVEAHFYERGGHGLPKGSSAERWFDALVAWMTMHGWVGAQK